MHLPRNGIKRATKLIAASLFAAASAVTVGVATAPTASAASPTIDVVVSPHPDDEMSAFALANIGAPYQVNIYMARGGSSTAGCQLRSLNGVLYPKGYNLGKGERLPSNFKPGVSNVTNWTKAECEKGRMESTVLFLRALSQKGFRTPNVSLTPTKSVNIPGVGNVLSHVGSKGAVLFFNLGDENTNTAATRDAINKVPQYASQLGLPTSARWHNIYAAAYQRTAAATAQCAYYPHVGHGTLRNAVLGGKFPAFDGYTYTASCINDAGVNITRTVGHSAMNAIYPKPSGPFNTYYNWLNDPEWFVDWSTSSQKYIFSNRQSFIAKPAR